jgi:hypothetical protein
MSALMDEKDPKAISTFNKLWNGPEAHKCDGKIEDISSIAHTIMTKPKRITKMKNWYYNVITNIYRPNLKVDYQI